MTAAPRWVSVNAECSYGRGRRSQRRDCRVRGEIAFDGYLGLDFEIEEKVDGKQ